MLDDLIKGNGLQTMSSFADVDRAVANLTVGEMPIPSSDQWAQGKSAGARADGESEMGLLHGVGFAVMGTGLDSAPSEGC